MAQTPQSTAILPVPINESVRSLDLAKVGDRVNILGPRGAIYAGDGMKLRAVIERLSTNPEDGDVYTAIGGGGKLSLSKNGLLKISSAKGIVWSPTESKFVSDVPPCEGCVATALKLNRQPVCPHNIAYRAVGAWLDPVGQWEVHSATKAWAWDEEIDEVKRLYRKQVESNKLNETAFEQRVQDEFRKRFRDRFSLAETKAKLRVVREVGVKAAYTAAEIQKGFLCLRVEPDISVEEARRRGMASAAQIFGAATAMPALPQPDFTQVQELNGEEPEPATTTDYQPPTEEAGGEDPWTNEPDAVPGPTLAHMKTLARRLWTIAKQRVDAKKLDSMPPKPPADDAPIADWQTWVKQTGDVLGVNPETGEVSG